MNSGEMVKIARTKKGWSQRRLAKEIGKSYGMIAQWESGITIPTLNFAFPVANVLGISFEELTGKLNEEKLLNEKDKLEKASVSIKVDSKPTLTEESIRISLSGELDKENLIRIPILGQVPAGDFREILSKMRDEAQKWEYISDDPARDEKFLFGFSVIGESMTGKDIQDGDIIIIDTNVKPRNGDVVMAMMNESTTIKTFWRSGETLTLYSANDKIDPIFFHENDKDNVKIIGKVIRVIKKL